MYVIVEEHAACLQLRVCSMASGCGLSQVVATSLASSQAQLAVTARPSERFRLLS